MSILNVNTIQPIGSGTTVTVAATELKTSNFITVGTGASVTSPSANVLTLGTNNAERFRIASNGNTGIGTNNPGSNKLQIQGSSAFYGNGGASATWGDTSYLGALSFDGSAQPVIRAASSKALIFQVNQSTEALRITSGGSVAIGVNSPSDKLHVGGNNAFIRVDRPNGNPGLTLIYNSTNSTRADIDVTTGGDLRFATNDSTERLRITSNGLVGVNCTPLAQFQVKAGTNQNIALSSMSSEASIEAFNDAGSANVSLRLRGSDLKFFTTSTERLRIASDGTVHVNSPDTASGGRIYAASSKLYLQSGNGRQSFNIADMAAGQSATHEFNSSGNLVLASGSGIDFSANSNASGMTSEVLDDYEEGTWTPTITGLGNHNNNAGSTWGKYTKIGNRVFITWRYSWTSRTTTNGGVVFLGSLPFSAPNDSRSDAVYIGGLEGVISNTGREVYGGQVVYNTNTIQFRASGHNVSENSLFGSLSTSMSSGYIYGGANYIV